MTSTLRFPRIAVALALCLGASGAAVAAPAWSKSQCSHALQWLSDNGGSSNAWNKTMFVRLASNNMAINSSKAHGEYDLAYQYCRVMLAGDLSKAAGLIGKVAKAGAPSAGVSGSATTQTAGELVKQLSGM